MLNITHYQFSSVSEWCPTLRPHESQHIRLPCPSPTPGACSNSCPSSRWCHPTISSSARHLKSFKFCHEKSCDSPLLPFFASADHLSTHPFKISLILSDLLHVLIRQNCFRLCLQFPSHIVSPPDSRHQHCSRDAFSITTVTRQAFDWKCGTGGDRGEPVECTWRLLSILMGETPAHWACLRRLGWTLHVTLLSFPDLAFLAHPHDLRRDLLQCLARNQTPCVSNVPLNLRVQCAYQEPVFPSDLQ